MNVMRGKDWAYDFFINLIIQSTIQFLFRWLKKLSIYEKNKSSSVILNGADSSIFKSKPNFSWDGSSPLKIVSSLELKLYENLMFMYNLIICWKTRMGKKN